MNENPLIVAHRGASRDAPENTSAAFMMAWLQGADAVEADLRLTRDNHIVCIHDKSTRRVASKTLIVADSTLAALKALDVGAKHFPKWKGQHVPTLAEVLAATPEKKTLFLELKVGSEILAPLKKELSRATLKREQVVIQSFDEKLLAEAAAELPGYKTLLLVNLRKLGKPAKWHPPMERVIQDFKTSKAVGVNLNAPALGNNPDLIKALKELGAELHTWTVNRALGVKPLLAHGLSSITTDRPGRLRVGLRW